MSHDSNALIEANALIAHLLTAGEIEKAQIAREMHDVVGAHMVAAAMDLAAASSALPADQGRAVERLKMAQQALHTAIDHGRRMVEYLRPTILDTFGLFAALQWQVRLAQESLTGRYTEQYPDEQPDLTQDVATALFRVAEAAISMTMRRGNVSVANLSVQMTENHLLRMEFYDNGSSHREAEDERRASVALSSMKHRLEVLGGTLEISRGTVRGTTLVATLPL